MTEKYMTPCPVARNGQHQPGYMLGSPGLRCSFCMKRIKVDHRPKAETNMPKKQPTGVRSIAVVWGDNDFGSTFAPLLETIRRAVQYHRTPPTQAKLRALLREGLWFHYIAFQDDHRDEVHDALRAERTKQYLSGDFISVKFDEEADLAVGTEDHDQSAWYVRFDDDNPVLTF